MYFYKLMPVTMYYHVIHSNTIEIIKCFSMNCKIRNKIITYIRWSPCQYAKDDLRLNIVQQEIWICKTINETNFNLISCNDIFCGFNTLRYLFHHLQLFQQHTWLCYHHIICSYTVWWCSEILHIILCIMIYILKIRYQKRNFQLNRNKNLMF